MAWSLRRRKNDPPASAAQESESARRRREERTAREARGRQAASRRRQVAGQLAAVALSWGFNVWLEGAMWFCLAGGLAVDYIGSYADLAATFGAFGYDGLVRWIMPLGIDLPVTASVLGQLLAGRWRCGWWVRLRLGLLTAATAPLTLVGNALRGAIDGSGHFTFHVQLWMYLAAFAVPGLGVVLIGWVASMMQGERAELTRRRLEGEAECAAAEAAASAEPASDGGHSPEGAAIDQPDIVGTRDGRADGRRPAEPPAVERPSDGQDDGPAVVGEAVTDRPVDGRPGGHEGDRNVAAPAVTGGPVSRPMDDHPDDRMCDRVAVTNVTARATARRPRTGRDDDREVAMEMTAEEARAAAVRLVRQARRGSRQVTAADVQRVTGRQARQSRRLLAQAMAAVADEATARRPRVLAGTAAPATAEEWEA
jgi:hypothetical protein